MSNVLNADMVEAARIAAKPHGHEMNAFTDICDACGRTAQQIVDRNVYYCDALLNHKRTTLRWGDR